MKKENWEIRIKFKDVISGKHGVVDTLYAGFEIMRADNTLATAESESLSAALRKAQWVCERFERSPDREESPAHRKGKHPLHAGRNKTRPNPPRGHCRREVGK